MIKKGCRKATIPLFLICCFLGACVTYKLKTEYFPDSSDGWMITKSRPGSIVRYFYDFDCGEFFIRTRSIPVHEKPNLSISNGEYDEHDFEVYLSIQGDIQNLQPLLEKLDVYISTGEDVFHPRDSSSSFVVYKDSFLKINSGKRYLYTGFYTNSFRFHSAIFNRESFVLVINSALDSCAIPNLIFKRKEGPSYEGTLIPGI